MEGISNCKGWPRNPAGYWSACPRGWHAVSIHKTIIVAAADACESMSRCLASSIIITSLPAIQWLSCCDVRAQVLPAYEPVPQYKTWVYLKRNELAQETGRTMFYTDAAGEPAGVIACISAPVATYCWISAAQIGLGTLFSA